MLDIRALSFAYGENKVLDNIDFSAGAGEFVAVLGPNGVGKSTFFRCILGLLRSYEGTVEIGGKEVRSVPRRELARLAAYIPQSSDPVFDYTVLDAVLMGTAGTLDALRTPGREQIERAKKAMADVGIYELRDHGIGRISGGERQLVLIARALAQNARLLVMDEPAANLDYGNQYRILEQFRRLTEQGYTVLLSTHNPDHALRFASHILALQGPGEYVTGTTAAVMNEEFLEKTYHIPVMVTETDTAIGRLRSCIPLLGGKT